MLTKHAAVIAGILDFCQRIARWNESTLSVAAAAFRRPVGNKIPSMPCIYRYETGRHRLFTWKYTMTIIVRTIVIALSLSLLATNALADGDAKRGKELYQICAACHGEDGRGNTDFQAPQLAGQYEWYLIRQLQNFQKGLRGADPEDINGAMMKPMADLLKTEQDILDVVAYVASRKPDRRR